MQVIKAPDPRLRVKTKPVKKITSVLSKTIREMIKLTKTFVDPQGVGLASTQVGLSEQFFVSIDKEGRFKTYFNPKIIKTSKKTKYFFEGCLSIPNYWGKIERPIGVTVSYLDEHGNQVKKYLRGIEAHIFQHECDHLKGRLFMDLVHEQKSKLYKVVGKDRTGADVFEEVPL